MSRIRYLLDEDTPHVIRDGLLRRQPEIEMLAAGDDLAPPLSTPDPEILRWMEREGYLLVTRNRRTMPRHLRDHLRDGGHVPGILIIRPDRPIIQVIDELLLIWEASRLEEYRDKIEYIPL